MIGFLSGKLSWQRGNSIIIDIDGVGYQVTVTDRCITPSIGKNIELFIYTYVREDKINLYGFETGKERELFKILLSVSRIGPSAATGILSALSYERFIKAIMEENISVLKEISGIGPKTAQRLILELKSKIKDIAGDMDYSPVTGKNNEELYEALQGLGYSRKEIDRVLKDADLAEDMEIADKIKMVLSLLGRDKM